MTKKTAIPIAAAALVAAGLVTLLGGVFRDSASSAPPGPSGGTRAEQGLTSGFSLGGSTAATVAALQSELQTRPDDAHSYTLLGLAYQQRARETGDPTYYTKSESALRRALALDRNEALAVSGLASLALARHRFRGALALARRARAASPYTARNYGAIGDALVELGRYREAFAAFDTMASLRPDLSAYARVSYARELLGRQQEAVTAMRLATESATGAAEPAAWTHVQLGKLYFNQGRYRAAVREYRIALGYFPAYAYGLDALAQAEAALGHLGRATVLERQAVETVPLPQYVALLGDLYGATGRKALAREQYALIGAIEKLLRANGVKTDLEIALFKADHGIDLRGALTQARRARRERPSIDGDDVLAWALYRNGRCHAALGHSTRALRLGTRDALKFFHHGMIERCLGHRAASRVWLQKALDQNPGFSVLWSPVARRYAG
jgi:tetratricopeptide (TPR) repeat protein